MTDRLTDLRNLLAKVEAGQKATIPTPRVGARRHFSAVDAAPDARIMGYVEGYVVMRHRGAMPFLMSKNEVVSFLKALIAQEEGR